jgi:hypothetical protein
MQYWTPDDGQKTCPKHVEFYSKNKFEKLVHLVAFIIRIHHDAWSSECQINILVYYREAVGWNCLNQDAVLQPLPVNLDVFVKIISYWIIKRLWGGIV